MGGGGPSEYKLYTEEEINKAKPKIDPNELNKDVDVLTGQLDTARKYSKEGLCTPQSIEADLKSLMNSLNSVDAGATTQLPNDPTGTALTGKSDIQQAMQSGAKIPDQLKSKFSDIGSMITRLSPELGKFIESLLGFFIKGFKLGNKESSTETDQAEIEKLKDKEQRKILDSYGVKIENPDYHTAKLKFSEGSKITGEKTPILIEPIDPKKPIIKEKISLEKDNSIILDTLYNKSIDIKENNNNTGFTLTVQKKDGSIYTYTVESAKKTIEAQKAQP